MQRPEMARGPERRLRSWGAALCLLALPALALGQSLGDAARQERGRREKAQKAGRTSRPLTEDDLATTKGQLANDPGAPQVTGAEDRKPSPPAEKEAASRAPEPAATPSQEAYWRGRARQARDRVAAADSRYQALVRMIRFGQPEGYDSNGRVVIYSVQAMKSMADEAEADLRAAQKALEDLTDEARRAGALPGWLRE